MIKLEDFNAKELALKHVYLMEEIEQLPPGTKISPAKRSEIQEIEVELKKKAYQEVDRRSFPGH